MSANARPREDFENWIEAVCKGDASAFRRFYDIYTLRLYKLSLILTRGDENLAKEVHQITMIKAARRFKRFRAEREIWPWLCQIARNSHVDHIRKESIISRLRALLRFESRSREDEVVNEEAVYEHLECALAALGPEDSALLNAAYFDNKTQKEIAADQDKSPKAVERRLSRIRQELRATLLKELKNE